MILLRQEAQVSPSGLILPGRIDAPIILPPHHRNPHRNRIELPWARHRLELAVARDVATAAQTYSSATSKSFTHTPVGTPDYVRVNIGSAVLTTNRALPTVTYGGTGMTRVGTASYANGGVTSDAHIYELRGPAAGAQTVAISWATGSYFGACNATTYTGVDQTVASGTPVTATGASGNSSLSITNTSGNMVSDVVAWVINVGSPTGNLTSMFNGTGGGYGGAGQDTTTAGSLTPTWTYTSNVGWAQIACEILVAASAGGALGSYFYRQVAGMSGNA